MITHQDSYQLKIKGSDGKITNLTRACAGVSRTRKKIINTALVDKPQVKGDVSWVSWTSQS